MVTQLVTQSTGEAAEVVENADPEKRGCVSCRPSQFPSAASAGVSTNGFAGSAPLITFYCDMNSLLQISCCDCRSFLSHLNEYFR